jgi:type IV secretion system protein VirB4
MFDFLEHLISSRIPVWGHIDDGAWLLNDGSVFAMVEIAGQRFDAVDPEDLTVRKLRLTSTYKQVGDDQVILSVYQCRSRPHEDPYPQNTFAGYVAQLDTDYRAILTPNLFENRTFVGVRIRPERHAGEFIGEQISLRQKPAEDVPEGRHIHLENVVSLLMADLKPYGPRRLGRRRVGHAVFSEIAEALVFAMTGEWRPIGDPAGYLGEAMFSEDIFIDKEHIRFVLPGSSHYACAFGMKHFPKET